MVRFLGIVISVFLCACTFSACRTLSVEESPEGTLMVKKPTEVAVHPSHVHKECMELSPSQALVYEFDCTRSVNFAIHYREGNRVIPVITKNNTTIHRGKFSPDKKQLYCLTWTNPHSSQTRLTYSFRVVKE
jgi:hypothetical protein